MRLINKLLYFLIYTLYYCFISETAIANSTNESGHMQGSMTSSFIMFGGLFLLMYFIMIRPQSKKAKEHKELINNLKEGDEVMTTSGFLGKVNKIGEQFIVLSLDEGVQVIIQKHAVASAVPKGTLGSIK